MKKHAAIIVAVLLVLLGIFIIGRQQDNNLDNKKPSAKPSVKQPANTPPAFDKTQYSTTDASSIWVIVNKQHQLDPADYAPVNLIVPRIALRANITSTEKYVRADMANALAIMATAAKNAGINLNLQSGYRSYNFQQALYGSYVKQQGQAEADTESARAGYSEHQTGLAADLGGTTQPNCNVAECFANTTEGKWLAANAYKYGFIIRYPQGKQAITGYVYEPWHIRYVGPELATEMHNQNVLTMEEFFDLPAATDYN